MKSLIGGVTTLLATAACAGLLVMAWPSRAQADEVDKSTLFTFDEPVALPGIALPAGTYLFRLADPDNGESVVAVFDQTGQTCYGLFLTERERESHAGDQATIQFAERPGRAPEAIAAWFYPGERTGWKFVYANRHANG